MCAMSEKLTSDKQRLDDELWELFRPSNDYIDSDECVDGHYYWGGARSIGCISICRGRDEYNRNQFEGLRNKLGLDFLFTEYHYDDDTAFGTYSPVLDLGVAPMFASEEATMYWILEQEINLISTRIDWLRAIPDRYKALETYEWLCDHEMEHLETLVDTKVNGFSNTPAPTFREIMEAKKRQIQT